MDSNLYIGKYHKFVEVESRFVENQGGWVRRISAEIRKTHGLSKNGIWWSCNGTPKWVAIASENHNRVSIGYGYDLSHYKVIFYVGHTII